MLLLPTTNIIIAGALAVAASFAFLLLVSDHWFKRVFACERRIGRLPLPSPRLTSFVSSLVLVALIWTGIYGSRDPLENLLTLSVWVLWWVVIVLAASAHRQSVGVAQSLRLGAGGAALRISRLCSSPRHLRGLCVVSTCVAQARKTLRCWPRPW